MVAATGLRRDHCDAAGEAADHVAEDLVRDDRPSSGASGHRWVPLLRCGGRHELVSTEGRKRHRRRLSAKRSLVTDERTGCRPPTPCSGGVGWTATVADGIGGHCDPTYVGSRDDRPPGGTAAHSDMARSTA